MIELLHHIAINVSREACLDFYKLLGFRETSRQVRPEKNDILVWMNYKDITLEIFINPDKPKRLTNPEAFGLRHVAFDVDDVDLWFEKVKAYSPEPMREYQGKRFFFVSDPDGCPFEFRSR